MYTIAVGTFSFCALTPRDNSGTRVGLNGLGPCIVRDIDNSLEREQSLAGEPDHRERSGSALSPVEPKPLAPRAVS